MVLSKKYELTLDTELCVRFCLNSCFTLMAAEYTVFKTSHPAMQVEPKTYVHWSERQDSQLVRVLLRHGRQWEMLQRTYFPEFNTKQMKNRFQYLARTALDQRTVERIRQGAAAGGERVKEERRDEQGGEKREETAAFVAEAPPSAVLEAFDSLW